MKLVLLAILVCLIVTPSPGLAKDFEPDSEVPSTWVNINMRQLCFIGSCSKGGGTAECGPSGCSCKCGEKLYNPYFSNCSDGTVEFIENGDPSRVACYEAFESLCSLLPMHPICLIFPLDTLAPASCPPKGCTAEPRYQNGL